MRFDFRDDRGNVRRRNHLRSQQFGQVIPRGSDDQAELEVLRVDPANMQGGNVAHRGYRQRQIDMCKVGIGCFRRRRLQLGQSRVPSRGVIVLGVEAFRRSVLKEQYHRDRLRAGLAVLDPGQRIGTRVVEFFYIVAIVSEIGPAQVWQRPGGDRSAEVTGALSRGWPVPRSGSLRERWRRRPGWARRRSTALRSVPPTQICESSCLACPSR